MKGLKPKVYRHLFGKSVRYIQIYGEGENSVNSINRKNNIIIVIVY